MTTSDQPLAGARAQVDERPDGSLLVSMPPKRFVFALIFVPLWLAFWTWGWVAGSGDDSAFLVVGPLGTVVVLALYLWLVAGREEIEVAAGTLSLRRRVGPLKHERRFPVAEVEDLRALPVAGSRWNDSFGVTHASMAFDHGARTHKFAGALDEAEAKHVARRLQEALR